MVYYIIFYYIILYYIILCYIYYIILCYIILYYLISFMLYYIILYYSILYCLMLHLGAIAGDEQVRITPSLKDQKGKFFVTEVNNYLEFRLNTAFSRIYFGYNGYTQQVKNKGHSMNDSSSLHFHL